MHTFSKHNTVHAITYMVLCYVLEKKNVCTHCFSLAFSSGPRLSNNCSVKPSTLIFIHPSMHLLSLTQFKVAVEPFPVRSGVHPVLMQTGIVIYSFHILTVKCVKGHLRNIIQPLPGSIRAL